jgi:hypothetical protein
VAYAQMTVLLQAFVNCRRASLTQADPVRAAGLARCCVSNDALCAGRTLRRRARCVPVVPHIPLQRHVHHRPRAARGAIRTAQRGQHAECSLAPRARARKVGIGIFPLLSLLNHSCAPNCAVVFNGPVGALRTIAPVCQGEPLTINYVDLVGSTAQRRAKLADDYFFLCQASAQVPRRHTLTVTVAVAVSPLRRRQRTRAAKGRRACGTSLQRLRRGARRHARRWAVSVVQAATGYGHASRALHGGV